MELFGLERLVVPGGWGILCNRAVGVGVEVAAPTDSLTKRGQSQKALSLKRHSTALGQDIFLLVWPKIYRVRNIRVCV